MNDLAPTYYLPFLATDDDLFRSFFFNYNTPSNVPPYQILRVMGRKKTLQKGVWEDLGLKGISIIYALAGFYKQHLEIYHEERQLYISGDNTGLTCLLSPIQHKFKQKFKHSFLVSDKLNLSETEIDMRNGLLNVFIPLVDTEKPKRISIPIKED